MMDYNHWSAFGLLGEILPWADNRVTLQMKPINSAFAWPMSISSYTRMTRS